MKNDTPETDARREPSSPLSRAVLRISSGLDLDTVLRETVQGARELTRARSGIILTVDDSGQPLHFVTSGVSGEVRESLLSWPGALQLFEHLRDLEQPLRVQDFSSYVSSLGYPPFPLPYTKFQATPMRHQGRYVGAFFLGEKEDEEEFTAEDENVLLLFAVQAAAAIANAQTYRAEQRSRAHLQTLLDTSPVGIVVLDARTGHPTSVNREATRIVASLYEEGDTIEKVLDALTCRRGDGQEVTTRELGAFETIRAEEVELHVPNGRSVRTLINVTPIPAEGEGAGSVVVTMQDLAPLDELERSRADFLSMVSHELRTPLAAIKGSAATALDASQKFDPAETRQFFRIVNGQADLMSSLITDLLDASRIDAGTLSVDGAATDVAGLLDQARNTFLSGGGKHDVLIDLPYDMPRVYADEWRIVQVLNNLLTNAARHSPESTPIRMAAAVDGVHVALSVSDEGEGLPPERLRRLFTKHAGSRSGSSEGAAGAGLGLSICKGLVEAHGGRIRAKSGGDEPGTQVTFTLPTAGEVRGARGDRSGASEPQPVRRSNILVVDNDPQALRYARDALTAAGYAPVVTADPRDVPRLVKTKKPALVLLDLILPGTDGIELMESLPELVELPTIFISAYGRDETIAKALQAGADDYIVKPFSPTELTARVQAVLRRRAWPERRPFQLRDLLIDYATRRVSVAGKRLRLTNTEYELLRALSVNAGRALTYDALLRQAWGGRSTEGPAPVRTIVTKLRRKLGDPASAPRYIQNERGLGYRMPTPDEEA